MSNTTQSTPVNPGESNIEAFKLDIRGKEIALEANLRIAIPSLQAGALERGMRGIYSPANLAAFVATESRGLLSGEARSDEGAIAWRGYVLADNDEKGPHDTLVELSFPEESWPAVTRLATRLNVTAEQLVRCLLITEGDGYLEEEETEAFRAKRAARHETLPLFYRALLERELQSMSKTQQEVVKWLNGDFVDLDLEKPPVEGWEWSAEKTVEGDIAVTIHLPDEFIEWFGSQYKVSLPVMVGQMTVVAGGSKPREDYAIAWFGYADALHGMLRTIHCRENRHDDLSECDHSAYKINLAPDLYRVIEWVSGKVGTNPGMWIYGCIVGFFADYRGGKAVVDTIREARSLDVTRDQFMPADWKGGFDE